MVFGKGLSSSLDVGDDVEEAYGGKSQSPAIGQDWKCEKKAKDVQVKRGRKQSQKQTDGETVREAEIGHA